MLKLKLQYFGHLMWRLIYLKRPLCCEKLKVGGERDDRGWDGWMATPTQWTWVLVNSRSWCWTGKSGILQPMGLQRVGHNLVIEVNWIECIIGEISASSLWITKDLLFSTSIMTSELFSTNLIINHHHSPYSMTWIITLLALN